MSPEERALQTLVGLLTEAGIPYMVTGSLASSHHGRPRATHDIDVVIDPTGATLDSLVADLLRSGFYVDGDTARDALRRRRQFNVIEDATAVKIDLILVKDRPFSREELARRRVATLGTDLRVAVATPEDSVLSKLEWSRKSGGSEKQLSDVNGILDVQGDRLDVAYIERWGRELDVLDLWQATIGGRRRPSG